MTAHLEDVAADLRRQVAALEQRLQASLAERDEAIAQQAAIAEVVQVINSSPGDLAPVFDAIVEKAMRLCGAAFGGLWIVEGDHVRAACGRNAPAPYLEYLTREPAPLTLVFGRAAQHRPFLQIPDLSATQAYRDRLPLTVASVELGGVRTLLGVPLREGDSIIGIINLYRQEVRPFSDRQIALVQSFAAQAQIAMKNARLFNETKEALERQTATAEVLKVISRSVFNLQTVLDTLVESAYRLCGARMGLLYLRSDDAFECKAIAGVGVVEASQLFKGRPIRAGHGTAAERVIMSGEVQSVTDFFEDPDFDPKVKAAIRSAAGTASGIAEIRSTLAVPMKRDDAVVGVIAIARAQTGPFPQRQVELLQTFADQAVIAIENARLFEEVQAKTRDLSEALVYQTGSSNILRVIAASPTEVAPVLQAIVDSACEVCDAYDAAVILRDGDHLRFSAHRGPIPIGLERWPINRGWVGGRAVVDRKPVHVRDLTLEGGEFPDGQDFARRMGHRTILAVPLMREGESIGAIVVRRIEAHPFSDKQIALLQTFADQAVIAIGNVRLFDEVQARTRDLEESLAQQTATADVLKVISRSVFDLNPVLQTLIDTAVRLARGSRGTIWIRKGDVLVASAFHQNVSSELRAYLSSEPRSLDEEDYLARAARDKTVVHISDLSTHQDPFTAGVRQRVAFGAGLWVPLIRDGETIGVFGVPRDEPIAFTDREIEIVKTFADQAVIAIENVRLFDEVQARTRDLSEALQQQTATADVLKVISRSAFDLQAVYDTLIASAVQLCGALSGTICVRDGDVFRYRGNAGDGDNPVLAKYLAEHPATPGRGTIAGRVLLSGKVEAIPDRLEDPEFVVPMTSFGHAARALLGVPLLGKDGVEGALVLTRKEPGHFTTRQIEIVQTFADQAVIAIENVRLFDQVQARTKELATSLDDLRAAQDRLIQSEKLASLGQLTAGIAHEIKNPLNFVNNFSGLSRELLDELNEVLACAPLDKTQRDEAEDLIAMVGANLDKVVQHGKRADSIVKNMLLHSREGSGERMTVNVNAMVEEALNLAYHGARAEKPGFNVTIAKSLDPQAGAADLHAQELTRVLLNLISNGFYATAKRKQGEANGDYEPTITASTRDLGDRVEIAIRDNGTGIPEEVKAKMFNPFFTTKPAGEGTGLGLSLSHDIVVKQHGGTIEVATEPGAYTQFTIQLPRAAQGAPVKPGAVH